MENTSGYTHCACRDCMDVAVSSDVSKPELCGLCEEAGCEPWKTSDVPTGTWYGTSFECQRDDAYGDDAGRSCGCGGVGTHGVDHGDYEGEC